jgi:acetyl esterase/lipase
MPPTDLAGVRREERHIPGPLGAPAVRVLIFTPNNAQAASPAYLDLPGGGYIMLAPEINDARNAQLARDLGCVVVSVDYRVGPETRFPGAVEDAYAALKWLHAQAQGLGVDPGRIAIGGESAGGGLAAALGLLARDRGEVRIAFQNLIYPMLDDRVGSTSQPHPYAGEFIWTAESNRFGWESLLGSTPGGADVSCYAAAARAKDLAGLPPTFIAVGALDLFIEENLEYARRLIRAGVPTELHVYPGAYHGMNFLAADAEVTKSFERDCRNALQRAFDKDRPGRTGP